MGVWHDLKLPKKGVPRPSRLPALPLHRPGTAVPHTDPLASQERAVQHFPLLAHSIDDISVLLRAERVEVGEHMTGEGHRNMDVKVAAVKVFDAIFS